MNSIIFFLFFILLPLTILCQSISLSSTDDLILAEEIADESIDDSLTAASKGATKRIWISCSDYQVCSERDRILWKTKRAIFEYLREAKKASEIGAFVEKDSPLVLSIRNRTSLCEDFTIAPFLLNKESDDWPIGCVWSGGQTVGVCGPAPPSDSFMYISPTEWSRKVRKFRTAIGCSKTHIKATEDITELYICRERCLDIGLGYYQGMILSLGCVLFLTAIIILD